MKRFVFLILVFLVFLLSGCINYTSNSDDSGVKVSDLTNNEAETNPVNTFVNSFTKKDCGSDFECFKSAIENCQLAEYSSIGLLGGTKYTLQSDCQVKIETVFNKEVIETQSCVTKKELLPYIMTAYELEKAYCDNKLLVVHVKEDYSDDALGVRGIFGFQQLDNLVIGIVKYNFVSSDLKNEFEDLFNIEKKKGWKEEYFSLIFENTSLKTQAFLFTKNALSNGQEVDFETKCCSEEYCSYNIKPGEKQIFCGVAYLPEDMTITELIYGSLLDSKVVFVFDD